MIRWSSPAAFSPLLVLLSGKGHFHLLLASHWYWRDGGGPAW
jgi:hypothetical protein